MQNSIPKYSDQSVAASRLRPGKMLRCSEEVGWHSMLVQTFQQPSNIDQYETHASPDALLVFVLEGSYDLESFSAGGWKKAPYRVGVGGFTAPFTTNRLRWSAKVPNSVQVVRLYIPQHQFAGAHEAFRPLGRSSKFIVPNALSLSDPTLFSLANAALTALELGESDVYADSCARFLATHLICRFENWSDDVIQKRSIADLSDRRLRRVLELMKNQFASALSIDQLAREAGISPFHFVRTFKAKLGVTPHRYIRRLRLRHARVLLSDTDLSVAQIAEACGYIHEGHFAAAFRKAFLCSPREFRKPSLGEPISGVNQNS